MTTKKKTTKKISYGVKEFKKELEKEMGQMTFGRFLEAHRQCEGLTQEELGTMIGVSGANICDLEKGRKIPSAKRAHDIAYALGMYEPFWVEIALQDQLKQQGLNYKVSIAD